MRRTRIALILALAAGLSSVATVHAQVGTAFTYQGELRSGGVAYSGTADIRLTLSDAATGGSLFGIPLVFSNVAVDAQGRFTVKPDFGTTLAGFPAGTYLNIEVRTPSDPTNTLPFVTLSPRAIVTPAPLASYAGYADFAGSATTATSADNALQLGGNDESFFLNAANLNAGTISDARLSPNAVLLNTPQTFSATKTFANSALALRNLANSFSLNLNAGALTAGRTITFPDASGTVITTGNRADLTLSGDVTGTAASTVVSALRGTSLSPAAPAVNNVLLYNGSQWIPSAAPAPTQAHQGDVIGTYFATTVRAIQGISVNLTTPTANQVLVYNGGQWAPSGLPLAAGTGLTFNGSTYAIANNGVTNAQLASDPLSLARVSGGVLSVSGANLSTTGSLTATGNITSLANAVADEFNYTAPITSYLMISDAAFTGRDGVAVQKTSGSGGAYPIAATTIGLAAPVNLPDGAVISNLRAYAVDNNAGFNLLFTLYSFDPVTSSFSTLASVVTTGASSSVQTLTSGTVSFTVTNATRSYFVTVFPSGGTWSDSSAVIRAVRIEYTMPRPAR